MGYKYRTAAVSERLLTSTVCPCTVEPGLPLNSIINGETVIAEAEDSSASTGTATPNINNKAIKIQQLFLVDLFMNLGRSATLDSLNQEKSLTLEIGDTFQIEVASIGTRRMQSINLELNRKIMEPTGIIRRASGWPSGVGNFTVGITETRKCVGS